MGQAKQRGTQEERIQQAKIKAESNPTKIKPKNKVFSFEMSEPTYDSSTIEEEDEIMWWTGVLLSRTLRCKVFDERRCVFLGEEKPVIIEIGNRLNDLGGFELMADVYEEVKKLTGNKYGDMRELECAWDGIGEWKS